MSEYPKTVDCDSSAIVLRQFESGDLEAMKAFALSLPRHDLLFLARDIRHPKVLAAWMAAIDAGEIDSLVALDGETIVGSTAVVRDELGWSPHVAELRLLIAEEMRGRGLGRILLQHCFADAVDDGAEKLTARMTPDQRGAIQLFEEMGFRGEALLRDQVRDLDGQLHDLAILSLDVARQGAQHGAYGFGDDVAHDA